MRDVKTFLEEASRVCPSDRQMAWFDLNAYAFIHFGVNTFTDREWGDGTESESIFDPAQLDCRQWVRAVKSAGLKGLILTAKHHDGFCLWPSAYTEHSVKNSPLGRDVVKEAAEACREGGLKFGVYLSPWDRNCPLYGTPEYNDYYCAQLTELLTGYGELFCIWLDGACGEGPNGRKQVYDFPRIISLVRQYQPGAVIFYDQGPDVRWCGNEAGRGRRSEWAVVPSELCSYAEVQTGPGPLAEDVDLSYLYNADPEIGGMHQILASKGLVFAPSEVDVSIRPGWFWHTEEEPHSLSRLFSIWTASVGGGACLNLNIPPNREGLLDARDVTRLAEFGELLQREFGQAIPGKLTTIPGLSKTQPAWRYEFDGPVTTADLRHLILKEDIAQGQRVESFAIYPEWADGTVDRFALAQGGTVGHCRILTLADPFADAAVKKAQREQAVPIRALRLQITSARGPVQLKEFTVC